MITLKTPAATADSPPVRPPRNLNPLPDDQPPRMNLRKAGRVRCEMVICGLGQVLDLSSTGMRVMCSAKPRLPWDKPVPVEIQSFSGKITVAAKMVWTREIAKRRHEVGLRFEPLDAQARGVITQIARDAGLNRMLGDSFESGISAA